MPLRNIASLRCRPPFSNLFPIDPLVKAAIKEDMEAHGFDASKPIDVWQNIVIDGNTRLTAAAEAQLREVFVYEHDFPDEQSALEYAIANQRNRRNLTDADIIRCVAALDERKREGRPEKTSSNQLVSGASRNHTAETIGASAFKVQQARTVLDHAPEPIKQEVLDGKKSINAAYKATQEQRRQEPPKPASLPTFNRTNDNIEWAKWTWNPVTGCLHDCPYCYARDIANRFYPEKFAPAFHAERLSAPQHTKQRPEATDIGERNVFVCSMADLFGAWVPREWIDAVLTQVALAPQWNFLFLSKNPERMAGIEWPANAWVGTTVDCQARAERAVRAFQDVRASVRFLSCEPLRERLDFSSLEMFDWVIIGGQTSTSGEPAAQPQWEWVRHLENTARDSGCKVYMKPNLDLMAIRPREYPTP